MNKAKYVGIWMDYASAHWMEYTEETMKTNILASSYDDTEKIPLMSERHIHYKEQHALVAYYKALGNIIKDYEHVLLFGPTDAKQALYNLLKADRHFDKIIIEVQQADKMTDNQAHAWVRAYFSQIIRKE